MTKPKSTTDFIAATIASLLHCFLFLTRFSTFMAAGADLDRGLPRFFLCLGSYGLSGVLDRELMVAVFGEAFDTIAVDVLSARRIQTSVSSNNNYLQQKKKVKTERAYIPL